MANEEQLSILKQGVEVWNEWRRKNSDADVDPRAASFVGANLDSILLWKANLQEANFKEASLLGASLTYANLSGADLTEATLNGADLRIANLHRANLIEAKLADANLIDANLTDATLNGAFLTGINLRQANLTGADLSDTFLIDANLTGAILRETKFSHTKFGQITLGSNDLTNVIEIESINHLLPSFIGVYTFHNSKGNLPEVFLRGCGLSDWEIEMVKLYNPELGNEERNKILYEIYELQASQAIQISPLFISYSHADTEFADKIGNCLKDKGVRYWRDIHEMKAGRMEKQIDRAIRQSPTVLLVLSEHSLSSDWVEHEVRTARALEKEMARDVLCPIALDDSWKSSHWPKRVMEQIMEYNILDFSAWQDDNKFESMFRKLIDGLELFYKG